MSGTSVDLSPAAAAVKIAGQEPGRIAVVYEDRPVGYAELARSVRRLAGALADGGVGRGDRVAYLGLNSLAFVQTYLAAAWLGAAFVPVNFRLAAGEVERVLRDSGAVAAVLEPGHAAVLAETGVPLGTVLVVDDDPAVPLQTSLPDGWQAVSERADLDPGPPVARRENDLAVLMFTSGTTGRPKGVQLTQGNIWWNGVNVDSVTDCRRDDVNLAVAPLFHIGALNSFTLRSLNRGGTTVIRRVFDPARTLQDLVHHRVNALFAVPAMFAAIARVPGFADADLSALRTPIVAGAPVPPKVIADWAARGTLLQQAWGLTETAPFATYLPAALTLEKIGSAGFAMPFTEIRVTDPATGARVTEPGARGQVCVRGANVTPGYWNNPDADAAAFDAEGWFLSGDIGHLDEDGCLFIVDRLKDMLIVGGENVYPAEVEAALTTCPEVADVAVVGAPHEAWGEAAVAVLTLEPGASLTLGELRDHGAEKLAAYKLPVRMVVVESIPRNAAGKFDKNAVRDLVQTEPGGADEGAAEPARPAASPSPKVAADPGPGPAAATVTRAELSALVRTLTAEALECPPSEVESDRTFLALGFDSLIAVAFRDRLAEAVGRPLPATLVFDHPTAADLVDHLADPAGGPTDPGEPPAPADQPGLSDDPIAIVGLGCRFPGGVTSPEQLWNLLTEDGDAVSGFPTDRGWDLDTLYDPDRTRPRTSSVREGGFLHDAADFDAAFFGLSPREALATDPQHRLLLETSWEALENAGIAPQSLRGSRTGVYAGVMYHDYVNAGRLPDDVADLASVGTAGSVASGRIAYTLGLEGPAVTVDTACSSSLVALHWAARALASGECDLALAGGATVMSTPTAFIDFSAQNGLSPDGRCRSFSDAAAGVGWSEGVGVVVLEKLSDARRNNHQVLALVRGSAVNQDGASNGLTAPNGPSQQRVIRAALESAGLRASQVDVVEGHGTGTPLGDPVEAQALLATYGQDRERPVWLGSVKSNLGHTQAAAGVAGVLKMVLALRHGTIPRTLYADEPSSHVDWASGAVRLLTEPVPWPSAQDGVRRAAVSSFGISGTNAHLVLEEAPSSPVDAATVRRSAPPGRAAKVDAGPGSVSADAGPAVPLVITGHSEPALRAQAERLAAHVRLPHVQNRLPELASALARTRSVLRHRAVVMAGDQEELLAGLTAVTAGAAPVQGRAREGGLALVFTGQGSLHREVGRTLAQCFPLFAEHFDQVLAQVGAEPGVLENTDLLAETGTQQRVVFAVQVALVELLKSWGIHPDVVVGHSVGELAAAWTAGVLSLEDAARLVIARADLMQALPQEGAMVSVRATEEEVRQALTGREQQVSVAAVNGPEAVVLSGYEEAALQVVESLGGGKRLTVSHAFHSQLMDPVVEPLKQVAATLSFHPPRVPFVSTVTGEPIGPELCTPDYWARQVRATVRFADAVSQLHSLGVTNVLEVGPAAVLTPLVNATLGDGVSAVPTLRKDLAEDVAVLEAAGKLFVRGVAVDWAAIVPLAQPIALPTYAFQRQRYWPSSEPAPVSLVESVLALADSGAVLTSRLSLSRQPWLGQHQVGGEAVLPAAALVALALRAGQEVGCAVLKEFVVTAPVVVTDQEQELQITVSAESAGERTLRVHVRADRDLPWVEHAGGRVGTAGDSAHKATHDATTTPPDEALAMDVGEVYQGFESGGLEHGEIFQGLLGAWQHGTDVYAEVAGPEEASDPGVDIHPALLDAALHAADLIGQPLRDAAGPGRTRLPFAWSGVRLHASGATRLRVRLSPNGSDTVTLVATDPHGAPVLTADAVTLRELPSGKATTQGRLFRTQWEAVPAGPAVAASLELRDWLSDPAEVAYPSAADCCLVMPTESEREAAPESSVARLRGQDLAAQCLAEADRARRWVQWWLGAPQSEGRLVVVTESRGVAAAGVRGLLRSAQTEHPDRFVILETDEPPADVQNLVARALPLPEPQLRWNGERFEAPRLTRVAPERSTGVEWPETVLITGGTGALGSLTARHLADRYGVRRLILASRRGPEAREAAKLALDLRAMGAEAELVAVDLSDREAVSGLLNTYRPGAVIHTAGVVQDTLLSRMETADLETVYRAKVVPALLLDELTRDLPITQFLVFSSLAGVLGNLGQGNYAAANAALDALMARRRADGLPGQSLAWGPWKDTGLAAGLTEAELEHLAGQGILPIPAEQGVALLDDALTIDSATVVPAYLSPSALRRRPRIPAVLHRIAPSKNRPADKQPREKECDWDRVHVLNLVRTESARILRHPDPAAVDPDTGFLDLGFDSLMSVELRNRLASVTGLELPATVVFDQPTPQRLATFVAGRLAGTTDEPEIPAETAEVDDPIAIVGLGCRYPGGVTSADDLWRLLADETDAVSAFPDNRGWDLAALYDPDPRRAGTSYVREGGFLASPGDFDAGFFGIPPRDALTIDPQQRLLLETSWEALEHAGIDPAELRGSRTGVFAGVMYHDYDRLLPGEEFEGLRGNGSAGSIASGRISYTLGLEGPAITVDTACSSSLVAMHLAAQALRSGECSLALAGGATVMATPEAFVEFSRQRGLAPDGRCRAFSDQAAGVGWSEGVGVVVLERLSDARRNGRPVLALVRGSAVNQDGASSGLTAPNGPSQQRVIRQALASAGLRPDEVDAVEGHGTGTRLGDPIEAEALISVFGRERERPLHLGSVKSNLGHTQAAAGVAGVIKMVQAMRHRVLPRTLHLDAPSSQVNWSAGKVTPLSEAVPWEKDDGPRRAGVSSFGISGTNAHLILEEAPAPAVAGKASTDVRTLPFVLSARDETALRGQARRLLEAMATNPPPAVDDVASALVRSRTSFEHRAVVMAADPQELKQGLAVVAEGAPGIVRGRAASGGLAMIFSGQGSQRPGAGAGLAERFPFFAKRFAHVLDLLGVGRTVLDDPVALTRTGTQQRVVFATQVALVELLASWGVRPDVVAGHSVGEIAAAWTAGVLSLEDAVRLVGARADLMQALPAGGAMVSLRRPESDVVEHLVAGVSVAAVNGPAATVVSGPTQAVEQVVARLTERFPDLGSPDGRGIRWLDVSHAFHSGLMDPMLPEFEQVASGLTHLPPQLSWVSTLDGWEMAAGGCSAAYWVRQARETVRFADAMTAMADTGLSAVLEVGPGPAVAVHAASVLGPGTPVVAALRGDRPEDIALIEAVATLHTRGSAVDWSQLVPPGSPITLPSYAFQHSTYWPVAPERSAEGLVESCVQAAGTGTLVLSGRISTTRQRWLAEHRVGGAAVLPAAVLVDLALRAGRELGLAQLGELLVTEPVTVTAEDTHLQVVVGETGPDGTRPLSVHTRPDEEPAWTEHAHGRLGDVARPDLPMPVPAECEAEPAERVYDLLEAAGLNYGPAFRGLRNTWRQDGEVYADIAVESTGEAVAPTLLDSALHAVAAADNDAPIVPRLPFAWRGAWMADSPLREMRLRVTPLGPDTVALHAWDAQGRTVLAVESITLRPVSPERVPREHLFRYDWVVVPAAENHSAPVVVDWDADLDATEPEGATTVLRVPAGTDPAELTGRALAWMRWWLRSERSDVRLVFVVPADDVAAAGLCGLVQAARQEQGERFAVVQADDPAGLDVRSLVDDEPWLKVSIDGRITAPRLVPAGTPDGAPRPWAEPVLVSGGTGGLGSQVARHLVTEHGVRSLVLAGRRGDQAEGARALADELAGLGAQVQVVAADLSQRPVVADLLAQHRPGSVIHAAGVLRDGLVGSLTDDDVAAVFAAKVAPALLLDELTATTQLSHFVVFSSLAGVLGNPGQGNYAAANAVLDALARRRRAAGLPGQSLAWGPWTGTGMAAGLGARELARLSRLGSIPISAEEGLRLMDAAASLDEAVLVPAHLDLKAVRAGSAGHLVRRPGLPTRSALAESTAPQEFADRLTRVPPSRRIEPVLTLVREQVAAVCGFPGAAAIGPELAFQELGMESLAAIELRDRLAAATGVVLPATSVFDHPTPRALAAAVLAGTELDESSGTDRLLAGIDALEKSFATAETDPGQYERIAGRLEGLRRAWAGRRGLGADSGAEELADVSDDEMFELLDNELS
ncbi:polyketide synthase [Kineosporia sp. NBRC 101677]|uniref:type I polyketide synthase n=1 Tax=Kineosporia sp. NBRC 101677 TaxID=3032197 RepID=UPI0024A331B4|nr:type I polyketide synthase [Kineosporia sp. NBRC 101677]GLY15210.1 polyketide synthase [Kineosporia sp. NBRC 101677]